MSQQSVQDQAMGIIMETTFDADPAINKEIKKKAISSINSDDRAKQIINLHKLDGVVDFFKSSQLQPQQQVSSNLQRAEPSAQATIVVRSYHSDTKDAYYVYTYDQHVKPVVLRTLSHSDVLPHLKDKKTFYLVDSLDVSNHAAKTIVVSSPDPSKYKEFLKDADSTRRYLPPWKKRELDTVRPLLYPSVTQVELDQLWNKWGGIPRFVLEKAHDQEFQRTLDQVIPTLDLDLCVKSVGQEDPQAPGSHKVIQIIPRDVPGFAKYSQMELRFSSKYVARIVVRETEKLHMDRITKELTVPRFLHSPLGGSFFEGVVHRKLQVGGTFKRRLLNNNNTGKESDVVIPKPLPSVDIKSINDISKASSATGAYLLPTYSNFPVVDSLIKPTQLFQVTVSSTHPPLMQELSNIVDQLGNPPNVDLYFVVPEDMYSDFKQQNYLTTAKKAATKLSKQVQTVTQYVLLFPLLLFSFSDFFVTNKINTPFIRGREAESDPMLQ
ncbi:hypothetical protein DFA_09224 [Cavenderia fasciculata]|uniref:Uncharacterized protein n=1 Tax=Cavenderia fasciculata TaxID=261658 RepID=F4Q714_CACFS|nr:uncharacterized protein DFA_09224 [Cavenderia fasciculata]EGG16196.1 hypothetical protein DFA_09224 [Cavenderia fasciculata]|eukprot:XP_004354580.1 hypothetical protein DFA_09224 [Cavenderia fasciculata]